MQTMNFGSFRSKYNLIGDKKKQSLDKITVLKRIRYQVSSDGQINRRNFCWRLLVKNCEGGLPRIPDARDDVDHVRLVRGVGIIRLK